MPRKCSAVDGIDPMKPVKKPKKRGRGRLPGQGAKPLFDSPEPLMAALVEASGYPGKASEALGISEMTFWNYRKKYPKLEKLYREMRPRRKEWVREKLRALVEKGKERATIYMYGKMFQSKREIIHKHGQDPKALPIQHRHVTLDVAALPLELKRSLLEHLRKESSDGLSEGRALIPVEAAEKTEPTEPCKR